MKQGSPSAGYHRRLLYPEILRDMMHAAFQMRPYRDQNRRSGRRSNTTNAAVRYAPPAPDRPLAQEDLGFHPALAYKYSGERGACKVGCCVMSSGTPRLAIRSGGHLQVKRFDSLASIRSAFGLSIYLVASPAARFSTSFGWVEMAVKQKLRIAFVRRGYSRSGGAEAYLKRLADGIVKAGHEVQLVATNEWPEDQWPFGSIKRLAGDDRNRVC